MKCKFITAALISLCAISLPACDRNRHPAETNPQDTSTNAAMSYSDTAKKDTTQDDLNRQTGGTTDRNTVTDTTQLPNSDIGQSTDTLPGSTDTATPGAATAPTIPNTETPYVSTPGADTQGAATRDSTSSTNTPRPTPNTGRSAMNPNDITNPNPSSYPSSGQRS